MYTVGQGEAVSQAVNQPVSQPFSKSVGQAGSQSTSRCHSHSVTGLVIQFVHQSVSQSDSQVARCIPPHIACQAGGHLHIIQPLRAFRRAGMSNLEFRTRDCEPRRHRALRGSSRKPFGIIL